jgi:hypothetical protein
VSDVTILTATIDDVFIIEFVKGKSKHFLYKKFPDANSDEMLSNVLNVIVPIINNYVPETMQVNSHFEVNEHCARDIWGTLVEDGFVDTSFENYKKPQRTYKIRSKETGQFSTGGSGGWSKKGKSWSCLAHLKSHLSQNYRKDYNNCEVIVLKEEKKFNLKDIDKYSG